MTKRSVGRPMEDIEGPYFLIMVQYMVANGDMSLERIIDDAIANKRYPTLDVKLKTEVHEKRVRRILDKLTRLHTPYQSWAEALRANRGETAKILPFRPK